MKNIKPYQEFKYWFTKESTSNKYLVINKEDDSIVMELADVGDSADLINSGVDGQIYSEFEAFKSSRPEYVVYNFEIDQDNRILSEDVELYETLLQGVLCMRRYESPMQDPDVALEVADSCISWLHRSDFFSSPASTKYHNSCKGGLLYHSLLVAKYIKELSVLNSFKKVDLHSAILVALVHDWCKIGRYETYLKNVKNEESRVWEKVEAYKYREDGFINLGHGVSSLYLASRFVSLSLEEAAAIRWHMGEYNVADNEMNELHSCNVTYPLVQMLQFADRLSITKYN